MHGQPKPEIRACWDLPSSNTDLSGWTLPNTGLNDITHVDLLYSFWSETTLANGMLDGDNTEFWSGEGGERAVDRANGRSRRGEDVDGLRLLVAAGGERGTTDQLMSWGECNFADVPFCLYC